MKNLKNYLIALLVALLIAVSYSYHSELQKHAQVEKHKDIQIMRDSIIIDSVVATNAWIEEHSEIRN